jgi:hypothetical protein
MSNQAHRDETKKIEYLFFNFDHQLSLDEMKGLIAIHGKPRRKPSGKENIKQGDFECEIEWPEIWEHQIIYRQRPDQETKAPGEIRACEVADIFSRMM